MSITLPFEGQEDWDTVLNTALTDLDTRITTLENLPASDAVLTVNTIAPVDGDVTLGYADVGAAPLSHTHAQADVTGLTAALLTKADDTAVVKLSGAQTIAGVKTFSSAPAVPDASFAIGKTSGLQAALDAKAALTRTPDDIYQNSDGSWPDRTTVTTDRTVKVRWVGTLPGPTIGSASNTAVAKKDWLIVTEEVPT